jgi:hypothetical protein
MKIDQATIAIEHFHDPPTQRMLRTHEEIVFTILVAARPGDMTLKEIACRFNEWTGYSRLRLVTLLSTEHLEGEGQDHRHRAEERLSNQRHSEKSVGRHRFT